MFIDTQGRNTRNQRDHERRTTDCIVELTWKSETGVAVECPEIIPLLAHVIVRAPAFEVAALAEVRHCTWRSSIYVLGLRFLAKTSTVQNDPCAPDHYEILRLNPMADFDFIERVYKTLARRFHPDNLETGDAETFLRVREAWRILSDPQKRACYDAEREATRSSARFQLRSPEFFSGVLGEQNRRLAILCLLYRKRTSNYEFPGLSLLDLERLTACTREELGFSLWYLCEKGHSKSNDCADYCLTADGVDFVEKQLARENSSDLRALAAVNKPVLPQIEGFALPTV